MQNDLQMASGGGGLSVGTINAAGQANLHIGDNIYNQPVIVQSLDTSDRGPHFWVHDYPTSDFTGREDYLASIRRWFLSEDNRKPNQSMRHKIVVLEGMGGCGKTQLALKFVHSVKSQYWGIFWVSASKEKIAQSAFAEIASHCAKGGLGSFQAAKQWLASRTEPWLLVLDNADEVEENLDNIQRLIPPGNHGHILITTRTPGLPDKFANSGRLHLRDMRPDEGIDLLLRCAYPEDDMEMDPPDRGIAGQIVSTMLYNLAKPIDAAGHYIRERKYTLERYLEKYLPQQKQRERENRSRDPADLAVETTWDIPITRIRKKAGNRKANLWRAHQDAIDLFHCFTFLHFTGIPRRVFHDVWRSDKTISTSDKIPDLLAPARDKISALDDRLEAALKILRDYAIIETVNLGDSPEQLNNSCYTFHPLVQSSARHALKQYGGEQQDLRPKYLMHAMHFLTSAIPIDAEDLDPKLARRLIPHVVDTMIMIDEIDTDADELESDEAEEVESLSTSKIQISRIPTKEINTESIMFSEEGAALYERLLIVYDAVGWWSESLPLYRKAMAIRSRLSGVLAESTLQVERKFSLISFLHVQLEDSVRAQLLLLMKRWRKRETWTSWFTNPLLPEHIPFCTALSDVSMTLWQAQKHTTALKVGKLAIAKFDKHLQRMQKLKQKPSKTLIVETLNARLSVGRTLYHMGDMKEAHEVLKALVRDCKKHLHLKHGQVIQYDGEVPLEKRRPPGLDHFNTLFARSDLALNLAEDLEGRQEYYKHIVKSIMKNVMEAREKILGDQHPYTLMGKIDYCKVLGIVGEPIHGFQIAKKTIKIAEDTLQDHGSALQLAYGSLARIYAYAEMWPEAADMMHGIYKDVPLRSPNLPMIWAAYARLSFRAGRHAAAEHTLRILLAQKEPSLKRGFKDAATENALEQLAVLYNLTNQVDKLKVLKQRFPEVKGDSALGSMYGVFNRQFKEEDDKLRTLIDLIQFLFADAKKGRIVGAMYDALVRYGDKKYGSELERTEAMEKVRTELQEEGLFEKAEEETKHLKPLEGDEELVNDDSVPQPSSNPTTASDQFHYERQTSTNDSKTPHETSQIPRTLPAGLASGHSVVRSKSQQSLVSVH